MQETMISNIPLDLVSSFWGGVGFDFEFVNANGNSSGLLSLWDPKVFVKDLVTTDCNFLHVAGMVLAGSIRVNIINVYAPQTNDGKRQLWARINNLIRSNQGRWIVFGDFNAVRDRDERKNSVFDLVCARDFNDFIDDAGLREYNLKGLRYTFMSNKRGVCKLSRIDRFLVCDNVFNKWPNACVRAINRDFSDHSPLVFSVKDSNFGPKPFRMFDSWLDRPGCSDVVHSVLGGWINSGVADINLLNKLKRLRWCLRDWFKSYSAKELEDESRLRKEKEELEVQMEIKELDDSDLWIWTECKKAIEEIEHLKARDLRQKSRVKWASLGDENSSFFHNVVNGRKARNSIPGIMINGEWVTKPTLVKREVLRFFRSHFKEQFHVRPTLMCPDIKKLVIRIAMLWLLCFQNKKSKKRYLIVAQIRRPVLTVLIFALSSVFRTFLRSISLKSWWSFTLQVQLILAAVLHLSL
ncbi:putative endonuclease/exonuclease/phosphatase [Helianthus annuus]|nr:putative endonuclease/exonuclease/phosphatase [Helianthus annuus]